MILDLQHDSCPAEFDCDVAIAGAGAVGIMMAVELARQGVDVLLLEAGGASLETSSQALYEARCIGHPLTGLQNGRFRLLGGTTNFWGGQVLRFDPIIFEPRPWVASEGWPFGREDLDPYYDRCARQLGLADDFSDADLWDRVGISSPDLGEHLDLFLTRCLRNRNLAHVFKADLEGAALRAIVHANVVGLSADDRGERITGLQIRTLAGKSASVRAKRVVLACGTIEISRLLMLPLADGRVAPWAANEWLGKGFLDHIEANAGSVRILDKEAFHHIFDNLYFHGLKYHPKIKLSAVGQKAADALEVAGRFEFRSNYAEHLTNLKLFARSVLNGRLPANAKQLPAHLAAVWRVALPLVVRYLKSNRAFNPADAGVDFMLMSEQLPTSKSRIVLASETDALGLPKVEVDWTIDGRETATMASFTERVRDAMRRLGLADIDIAPLLAARDPSFLLTAQDYYHQMGGARMGASAQNGVVDADLQVYGSQNLYVAGAAVYPFSGFGNPTYTAMALGLRLNDHLLGQRSWKQSRSQVAA